MHVRLAVRQLTPYRPGRPLRDLARYGVAEGVKLGSNENPLGPSERVLDALRGALPDVGLYPEPGAPVLREALAARFGRRVEEVITGAGIDDLLDLTVRCMLDPGDSLVLAAPGFVRYAVAARCAGGAAKEIPGPPHAPYRHDLARMLDAIDDRTRIVVLVSPNNPTGALLRRDELEWFFARVPADVLTIVDEAYFEYVDDPDRPNGLDYLSGEKPVLVFRTCSKIHALAGLRVGYGFGPPELLGFLDRARLPFNVNALAQTAALAALDDAEHVERSRRLAREEVAFLDAELARRGWKTEPSWANFVFAEAPLPGDVLTEGLLRRGFILRPLTAFGLADRFFRVSHGTREQNVRFLAAVDEVRAEVDGA